MRRMKASDFHQELLDIYDGYAHGLMSKREFLDKASKFAVAGVAAPALLEMLSPEYALARQVEPDDPTLKTEKITYQSPDGHGPVNGLMAWPAGAQGKLGAVLVVHENRGLNPYIEDVARRVAKAGFLALAPDGLTSLGGYPGTDDEGKKMQKTLDKTKLMQDFFAGVEFLLTHNLSSGKVGSVGFCYGGGVCNALAVAYPELAASVPFYGRQPKAEDVARIKAPLLLHYAELDKRVNAGWPDYEATLKQNGKEYTAHVYPGVNHGFHNDTTPRYDEPTAALAWQRTISFFNEKLK
jgi:carboxymethylenebutenolidase